ncbi:hypothetical protein CLTEP_02520 [Clostridium tepidiprofundi DSM 19306]|uniref:Uncharacterized protein n=1 Tax=Clostridium tepidiprofundi DSM 19306 TaxID=1121338 RepID=A0A151B7J0_9CLOT|nr:hypothetical protein [Clostridium tepidiprofundi]KYH35859.1 hypothetical protein CLTEP_02520 [Clostridium tepidiprofundi DSM 19306]
MIARNGAKNRKIFNVGDKVSFNFHPSWFKKKINYKGKVIFANENFFTIDIGIWRESFNWVDLECLEIKDVKVNG